MILFCLALHCYVEEYIAFISVHSMWSVIFNLCLTMIYQDLPCFILSACSRQKLYYFND